MGEDAFGACPQVGRDFGKPDGDFGGFDLAEEGANAGKVVMTPVVEEAGGFGGDVPVGAVGEGAPGVDLGADFLNDGGWVVGLAVTGEACAVSEGEGFLIGLGFLFAGAWDGRDVAGVAAGFDDLVGGLAGFVEFPVAGWVLVGGVEDGG